MATAVYLLLALAILGAADTIYYHEWRARLPGLGKQAQRELQLHALRDFAYAVLFVTVPWVGWHGAWAIALAVLFLAEVVLTLWDFVVEDWVRKPLGGLYPGERIMHAVMGIVYGAMLAFLVPILSQWWTIPTKLVLSPVPVASGVRWRIFIMGWGVLVSGVRDMCAAFEIPGSAWPWRRA